MSHSCRPLVTSTPLPIFTVEARIKRRLRAHFKDLGFRVKNGVLVPPIESKEVVRTLHSRQRADRLTQESTFVEKHWHSLKPYFANGTDVDPLLITPRIELIQANTWQSNLFRLATLTWSIPVSHGYGRRMRYLVWDDHNEKLIGLLALGDPVFNLRARDEAIGWSGPQRSDMLVNTMDAYVLGALPPYNELLCGKLVACLAKSDEIHRDFERRYDGSRGIISGRTKHASLVLVTTSSALGRSSVYNRLKLQGEAIFRSVGFTAGWGHFHIPEDLFEEIRAYLRAKQDSYAGNHEFGEGPNWRLRTIRKGLDVLGVDARLLKHGIGREVFVCEIASNALEFLKGTAERALFADLQTVAEIAYSAKQRWVLPRAQRNASYRKWRRNQLYAALNTQKGPAYPELLCG